MASTPPASSRSDAVAPLELDAFLPYRLNMLSSAVADGFARSYRLQSARFGIDGPQWRVISFLGERVSEEQNADGMTARDICARTRMTKVMVSRAIAELESAGFVRREVNEGDRRAAFLYLTPAGKRLYWAIIPVALRYQERLLEGVCERDRASLFKLIDMLQARAIALVAPADDDAEA